MIRVLQGLAVASEADQAAFKHGFPIRRGEEEGWSCHVSTTVRGTIWLAATAPEGPWFLATDRPAVVQAAGLTVAMMPGPGLVRVALPTTPALWAALDHLWSLWSTVPVDPVQEFQAATAQLPQSTEAERLVVQRIGQDIFRARLVEYWQGRCPLTGITDPQLLRASHIIPWSICTSDAERLDPENGFLLSALWDAAFDRGLVTFGDDGYPWYSPQLSLEARASLACAQHLFLTTGQQERLAWHRANVFVGGQNSPM